VRTRCGPLSFPDPEEVSMTLGDPYVGLEGLKDYLKIPENKINDDDALMDAITSASGEIERTCNRQFNRAETATARRYAPSRSGTKVKVDDFYTTDDLVVEVDVNGDGTWTVVEETSYEVYPANGVSRGQTGWPYYEIHLIDVWAPVRRIDRVTFRPTVRVTAKWGWEEVPAPIRQACTIMAAETFQLKDAPFGVAGSDQFGNVLRVRDNRIAAGKLARYVRDRIPVG
jgi:hypothetical protein